MRYLAEEVYSFKYTTGRLLLCQLPRDNGRNGTMRLVSERKRRINQGERGGEWISRTERHRYRVNVPSEDRKERRMGYIPTSENVSPPRDAEHDKFADHDASHVLLLLLLRFLVRLLVRTMRPRRRICKDSRTKHSTTGISYPPSRNSSLLFARQFRIAVSFQIYRERALISTRV